MNLTDVENYIVHRERIRSIIQSDFDKLPERYPSLTPEHALNNFMQLMQRAPFNKLHFDDKEQLARFAFQGHELITLKRVFDKIHD